MGINECLQSPFSAKFSSSDRRLLFFSDEETESSQAAVRWLTVQPGSAKD